MLLYTGIMNLSLYIVYSQWALNVKRAITSLSPQVRLVQVCLLMFSVYVVDW